jgi:hypothetical protein
VCGQSSASTLLSVDKAKLAHMIKVSTEMTILISIAGATLAGTGEAKA